MCGTTKKGRLAAVFPRTQRRPNHPFLWTRRLN